MPNEKYDTHDMKGFAPLHHAVHDRELRALTICLSHDANPNIGMRQPHILMTPVMDVPFPTGTTPLHLAATLGHAEMILPLIFAGADPNIKDKDGFAPLDRALSAYLYYDHLAEKKEKSLLRRFNGAASFKQGRDNFANIVDLLLAHNGKTALMNLPPEFQKPATDFPPGAASPAL